MTGFFSALVESDFLRAGFAAGLLAAVACGLLGPLVVTRRMVFLCEGIAHAAIFGVGAGLALRALSPAGFAWLQPQAAAALAAVLAALALAWLHERNPGKLDAMVGGLLAIGLSGGVLLAGWAGHRQNLGDVLFGNIASVSWTQAGWLAGLVAVICAFLLLLGKQVLALCCDEQALRLAGGRPALVHTALLVLVALSVVAMMQVVGLILVLALIALPAATAALFAVRLPTLMLLATALGLLLAVLPRALAFDFSIAGRHLAPEPAIVLSAGAVFLLALLLRRVLPRLRR